MAHEDDQTRAHGFRRGDIVRYIGSMSLWYDQECRVVGFGSTFVEIHVPGFGNRYAWSGNLVLVRRRCVQRPPRRRGGRLPPKEVTGESV
jgi:hypothetical protein